MARVQAEPLFLLGERMDPGPVESAEHIAGLTSVLPGKRGPQVVLVVPDSRSQLEGPEAQVTAVVVADLNLDPVAREHRSLTRRISMERQSTVLRAVPVEHAVVHQETMARQDR